MLPREMVMRVDEMITKDLLSNSLNKFFKEMYGDQFGELIICKWISGLKRIKNPTGKWRT